VKHQHYIDQTTGAQFSWDFLHLIDSGRLEEDDLHWSYIKTVKEYFPDSRTLLDMGTGGGEFLSSLTPLPETVFATVSCESNLEIAKKRLSPLGVNLVCIPESPEPPYNDNLPFESSFFNLIINRHEAYCPGEIKRILRGGGYFITQQMGALSLCNLILDLPGEQAAFPHRNLMSAVTELEEAGFKIHKKREQLVSVRFYDVDAVVCCLKNTPWLISGFSPDKYKRELGFIGSVIDSRGFYQSINHYFLIIAQNF
jgi:SAM-dependent methyltransferase